MPPDPPRRERLRRSIVTLRLLSNYFQLLQNLWTTLVFVLPSTIAWHAHPAPTCEVFLECIKLKCTCTNALATFCVTVRQLCCYVSKGQAVWFGLAWLAFQQCVRMLHVATRFCCAVHNNIIFVQQQEQTYCTSLRLIHSYQVSAYQTKLYKMSMYCHWLELSSVMTLSPSLCYLATE